MAQEIDRERVRRFMEQGAQIVDVLPGREYGEDHLPGAINLPLRRIETEASRVLDSSRPVVVYCADSTWDLSPRAACRLEILGFTEVYDYRKGKQGWTSAGLPTEGTNAERPRLVDVVRRDVPTCSLGGRLSDVRSRAEPTMGACVVVSEERVVVGLLRAKELHADPGLLVDRVT